MLELILALLTLGVGLPLTARLMVWILFHD